MLETNLKLQLIDLFRQAGPAHHQAYIQTDGADPEWPIWYAGFLYEDLMKLLDKSFTRSELIAWLVQADKSFKSLSPEMDWTEYYAEFILQHLS